MTRLIAGGEGQLYERLVRALANIPVEALGHESPDLTAGDCLLFVTDAPSPDRERNWQHICRLAQAYFLPVKIDRGEVVLGPSVGPGKGCVVCVESRRFAVHPQKERVPLMQRAAAWVLEHPRHNPRLSPFAVHMVAERLRAERNNRLTGQAGTLNGQFWVLGLDTLFSSAHRFLPVPTCPVCGSLPEDAPELVEVPETPRPKADRLSFRAPEHSFSLAELQQQFVDNRAGVVANQFHHYANAALAFSTAELALDFRNEREHGIGRSLSFADSEFTGLLEALERYSGLRPLGKRTAVHGSYRELAPQAVDPRSLILHSPEQYKTPNFRFVPYQDDLAFNWVWGYSFHRRAPVLVPEQLVYYRLKDLTRETNDANMFAYEISNGCALGGCLEEAILHGLFEVAERDGFLLTWYAKLSAPRIDLSTLHNRQVDFLLDRLAARGYAVHAFNITYDFGIPAVWIMAVNERNGGMKTFSAAGAHLNPTKAVFSGLVELTASLFDYERVADLESAYTAQLVENLHAVRSMRDHVILYGRHEMFGAFDFLLGSNRPLQSIQQAFPDWYGTSPNVDLTYDLKACVQRVLAAGCDVIAVDQTPPEQRAFGLRTVKVLVTGALPMTFGHPYRRTEGATRLETVPVQFGFRAIGEPAIVNPLPHPFP